MIIRARAARPLFVLALVFVASHAAKSNPPTTSSALFVKEAPAGSDEVTDVVELVEDPDCTMVAHNVRDTVGASDDKDTWLPMF